WLTLASIIFRWRLPYKPRERLPTRIISASRATAWWGSSWLVSSSPARPAHPGPQANGPAMHSLRRMAVGLLVVQVLSGCGAGSAGVPAQVKTDSGSHPLGDPNAS